MSFTVVFLHAHPDDEAILTGGTMARLAAEGNRVVLVVATAGEAGLASSDVTAGGRLGATRAAEVAEAARRLGCSRVEMLGYGDSGMDAAEAAPHSFSRTPAEEAAGTLARLLKEEEASALVGYDPAGGYGHPDHLQVHRVARIAASLVSVPILLEATVDRRALHAALAAAAILRRRSEELTPASGGEQYADPSTITHAVNVLRHTDVKRAALAAHASQVTADGQERSIEWLLRLPMPLFRLAMGREWFTEVGRQPGRRRLRDPLASLRSR